MPRPKGAVSRSTASKRTADKQGGIERLRADDPRVAVLLTSEQRRRLSIDPNYSFDVEFSPVRASSRGGRTTLVPTRIIEGAVDLPLRDFVLSVDQQAFVQTCDMEADGSKWKRLAVALSRPGAQFMRAVKSEGVSLLELNQFWLDSQQHRGTIRMANHLPDVMEETAVEARQKTVKCRDCDGTQVVAVMEKPIVELPNGKLAYGEKELVRKACPACVDSIVPGTVVRPGDVESKKLMFNALGILKPAGTSVNFDNRTINVGAVEGEVSAIGRILERKPAQLVSAVVSKENDPDA